MSTAPTLKNGKPSWEALGLTVGIVAGLGIPAIAGICVVFLTLYNINSSRIDKVEDGLTIMVQREIERNNRLEREMGGVLKVNELFEKGKLNLNQ